MHILDPVQTSWWTSFRRTNKGEPTVNVELEGKRSYGRFSFAVAVLHDLGYNKRIR